MERRGWRPLHQLRTTAPPAAHRFSVHNEAVLLRRSSSSLASATALRPKGQSPTRARPGELLPRPDRSTRRRAARADDCFRLLTVAEPRHRLGDVVISCLPRVPGSSSHERTRRQAAGRGDRPDYSSSSIRTASVIFQSAGSAPRMTDTCVSATSSPASKRSHSNSASRSWRRRSAR